MAEEEAEVGRRDFLKLAMTTGPAVAAVAVVGGAETAEAAENAGEGLRKTEHVKKYLESARF